MEKANNWNATYEILKELRKKGFQKKEEFSVLQFKAEYIGCFKYSLQLLMYLCQNF